MHLHLSHREARERFGARVDAELVPKEELELTAHLDGCPECQEGWTRYQRTVQRLRTVERERPPPTLASQILRRARNQRPTRQRAQLAQANRVPAELLVPVLVAVAVAAYLMLMAS